MIRHRLPSIVAILGVVAFLVLWLLRPTFSQDATEQRLWESVLYRLVGCVVFLALLIDRGYALWQRPHLKYLAVLLPCLVIAVNNLPILAMLWGDASVTKGELLWLFSLDCLLVGAFEELAFRGTLQTVLLEKRKGGRPPIFWTVVLCSALFGAFHLINLLEGAGITGTLLQVGYSFLIGGMCSIVLLKTGNLIWCILLHAIYNFCGGLIPTLGEGKLWDTPTVVITVILSLIVGGYMIWVLLGVSEEEAASLLAQKKKKE